LYLLLELLLQPKNTHFYVDVYSLLFFFLPIKVKQPCFIFLFFSSISPLFFYLFFWCLFFLLFKFCILFLSSFFYDCHSKLHIKYTI
jgi:hypothetical protein